MVFGKDQGSVTHNGNKVDILTGDAAADVMVGGTGDNTLIGNGGADVLYGGAGDDILSIGDNSFFKLKGGNGTDTLKIDGFSLDLTGIANNKVQGIEKIDMTDGNTTNCLTLNLSDVLNLSDSTNTLIIDGEGDGTTGGSDEVTVSDGTWTYDETSGGYDHYSLGEAILLIGTNIYTDPGILT